MKLRLGARGSALSLAQAGLVRSRPQGRFVYYSAAFDAMQSLVEFLTENCCGGAVCAPARTPARKTTPRRIA